MVSHKLKWKCYVHAQGLLVRYLDVVNGCKHTLIRSLKNRNVSAVPQSSAAGILTISKRIFNPHGSSAVCTSDLMCSTTTNIVSEAEYRKCKPCNSHVNNC